MIILLLMMQKSFNSNSAAKFDKKAASLNKNVPLKTASMLLPKQFHFKGLIIDRRYFDKSALAENDSDSLITAWTTISPLALVSVPQPSATTSLLSTPSNTTTLIWMGEHSQVTFQLKKKATTGYEIWQQKKSQSIKFQFQAEQYQQLFPPWFRRLLTRNPALPNKSK